MSDSYISAELRRQVAGRAAYVCEYCLIHDDDTFYGCQIDHIISEKHGGQTTADNLAYACAFCNRYKGSDIGSITTTGEFVRLFNPRIDRWGEHFTLDGVLVQPLTAIGEVTIRILQLNLVDHLVEREALRVEGRYPAPIVFSAGQGL
ncbi:MAG: HNH endonuclease [Gammaproteobacteria bacterium]|nr:HNH endonuclease [Gammaproteobacteria bacterium]